MYFSAKAVFTVDPRARGDDNLCAASLMVRLPPHTPGMRIGLFGGTFDPPHAAHRAACLIALNRLGLDRVWWMVTPGNPLKDTRGLAPLAERIRAARDLAHHPRIDVTGFEADIGTGYTFQTIRYLRRHCPGVRFVWIMGADNLRSFHRWQNWRGIADLMPIAVIDRLGPSLYATASTAGQALAGARIPETAARSLPDRAPPAWVYLHGLKSPLSSTALRALRGSHKTDAKAPQYADYGTPAG
jgi:nicotinate-nucleotide adenylyltransferase